jgi:hypothetical protein
VQFSAQGTDQDSQHYRHIINPALNREPGFLGEEIMDISMMIFRTATAPLFVGSVGRK